MVIGRSKHCPFPLLEEVPPPPLGEFLPSLCEVSLCVSQSRALTGHRMGMANEDMDTLLELRASGRMMK